MGPASNSVLISFIPEFRNSVSTHGEMGGDSTFKRLSQQLRKLLAILFRQGWIGDPASMPYRNLGLFQVSSMGRGIPYYYSEFLLSWDLPLPTPIPKFPPTRMVGMVTLKPSQSHPGLLPKRGNVHTGPQYFPFQDSKATSFIRASIRAVGATTPASGPTMP